MEELDEAPSTSSKMDQREGSHDLDDIDGGFVNFKLPEQLQKISPSEEFVGVRHRWNTNEEIASVLIAFDRHKEWLVLPQKIRPASGSMLLYNRKVVFYRRDGYCWKKRRNGSTIREDHMKLKVQGLECIYGSYVHSAILPTFHRRCYWLLQNPNIVLIHYLNVQYPETVKPSIPSLSYELRQKDWSKEELVDQLRPMLSRAAQNSEHDVEDDQKVEKMLEEILPMLIPMQESSKSLVSRPLAPAPTLTTPSPTFLASTATPTPSSSLKRSIRNLSSNTQSRVNNQTDPLQHIHGINHQNQSRSTPLQSPQISPHSHQIPAAHALNHHLIQSSPLNVVATGSNLHNFSTNLPHCSGSDVHHNLQTIHQENNINNNSSGSFLNQMAVTSDSSSAMTVANDRLLTSYALSIGESSSIDSKNFRLQQISAVPQVYSGTEINSPSSKSSLNIASNYLDNDLAMNTGLGRGLSPSTSSSMTINQYLQNQESRQQTSGHQHNFVLSQHQMPCQTDLQQNHSFIETKNDSDQQVKLQQQPVLTLCLKPTSNSSDSPGFVLSLQGATIVSQKDNQQLVNLSTNQGLVLVANRNNDGFVLNQILPNPEPHNSSTLVNSFETLPNKATHNLILSPFTQSPQTHSCSSFTAASPQSGNNSTQPFIYSSPMTTSMDNASHQPSANQHDYHRWYANISQTPSNAFPLKVDTDLVPAIDSTFKDESSVPKKNKSVKESTNSLPHNSATSVCSSSINNSAGINETHPVFTWALVKNGSHPSASFLVQHSSNPQQSQVVLNHHQEQQHHHDQPELTAGLSELNSSTKDMITSSTSCDTLDGSFSSLPSADLNLDDLLDVNDLDDVSDLGCLPFTSADLSEQPINGSDMTVGERSSHLNLMTQDQNSSSLNESLNVFGSVSNSMVYQQNHEQQQQRQVQIHSCFPANSESLSCSMTMLDSILQSGVQQQQQNHSLVYDNITSPAKCADVDPELNAVIKDFSPDWAYTKTNTKILVAGPWFRENAFYSCVFDGEHIPALLIQPGLLRCFTQYHSPGYVTLQVARDGVIISNCEVFEFCDRESCDPSSAHPEWFAIDSNQLKLLLIERLDQLRQRFVNVHSVQLANSDDMETLERSLVKHVQTMLDKTWADSNLYPKAGQHNLTLLHLAAGLGFAKLISCLFRWRMANSCVALEFELDTQSVDSHACTPLMWACALGKIDAALTLYRWNASPLRMCNKDGLVPLTLAKQKGHYNLASQIEQLERAKGQQEKLGEQHKDSASSHNISSNRSSLTNCSHGKDDCELKDGLVEIRIIPPAAFSKPGKPGPKLTRRFSEQVIGHQNKSLSKRNSVDLLPSGQDTDHMSLPIIGSAVNQCVRESSSEPHLPVSPDMAFVAPPAPRLLLEDEIDEPSPYPGEPSSSKMDTDEVVSVPSCSPVVDVERISSDEEVDANKEGTKHQMVTLANQIIAAIPERIKLSPSKADDLDDSSSGRARSESHSSLPSQGSPHPSSFGDDSGISTPMTDSLAFEECRYPEFGTPASSLSPDSTCLPSPYSAYSFTLDSPPPTTAEFTEYFNAPTTYMEKDFSQLTLSDQEQRKLYEAAKVIQNAYRHYRDKQQQQQQLQHQKEIEAAVLIQSYYRRYKTYAYYKKMSHAAVLIQNQFRTYYAKRKKRGDTAASVRRESERLKKGRNQSVIIQQRFRSHYQRRSLDGKEGNGHIQGSSDAADSSPTHQETSSQFPDQTSPADTDTETTATNTSTNENESCEDRGINNTGCVCNKSMEMASSVLQDTTDKSTTNASLQLENLIVSDGGAHKDVCETSSSSSFCSSAINSGEIVITTYCNFC